MVKIFMAKIFKLIQLFFLGVLTVDLYASPLMSLGLEGKASMALTMSQGGDVVMGMAYDENDQLRPYKWTAETGPHFFIPHALNSGLLTMSATGDRLIGYVQADSYDVSLFEWRGNGSPVKLLDLNGWSEIIPTWVNQSGEIIMGHVQNTQGKADAFVWHRDGGVTLIKSLLKEKIGASQLVGAKDDGSEMLVNISDQRGFSKVYLIEKAKNKARLTNLGSLGGASTTALYGRDDYAVGRGFVRDESSEHAFVWTRENGMWDLGTLGGQFSAATNFNRSKKIAVGYGDDANGVMTGFIWFADKGMIPIKDYFVSVGVVGAEHYFFESVMALSDDGKTFVGNGINKQGIRQAWLVVL